LKSTMSYTSVIMTAGVRKSGAGQTFAAKLTEGGTAGVGSKEELASPPPGPPSPCPPPLSPPPTSIPENTTTAQEYSLFNDTFTKVCVLYITGSIFVAD
jgi:hypothetical protein